MRRRNHEIKIRLNDKEYARLQKQVAKTPYTRETFLRFLLEGNILQECPKDYREFIVSMKRIATQIGLFRWNESLSADEHQRLAELCGELWDLIHMLEDIYRPFYKKQ